MTRLTVQISVTRGKYLETVLSSIRNASIDDVEIIVVNSGGPEEVSKLCCTYDAMEIRKKCSLLMSRFLGSANATGDYILILDETRVPSDGLIEAVIDSPHQMIAFPEVQVGEGFINWLDGIDKQLTFEMEKSWVYTSLIIPRLYSTELLNKVFSEIQSNISPEKFSRVVAKDDRIIFYEAQRISGNDVVLSTFNLLHYNDTNILNEFKKYARYGSTSRVLRETKYEFMNSTFDKFRKLRSFRDLPVLILYGIRGLSYEAGYYFFKNNER